MNINIDYLIYSSHKTSTQSMLKILRNNGYKSIHCHILSNINMTNDSFLEFLNLYNNVNKKKLKIITIIRDPIDRLISSFFQCYHNDEININYIKPTNTTIMKNDVYTLHKMFQNLILTNGLPTYSTTDSIDEINDIDNNLIELYVLDFNMVINQKLKLSYINKKLNINLTIDGVANLTKKHIYYNKYLEFKKLQLDQSVIDTIKNKFI